MTTHPLTTPTVGHLDEYMCWVVQIARVCHEANRGYCGTLGDTSQLPWDDAPAWQRKSAIEGVEFHLYHLNNNLPVPPHTSHEEWSKAKLADGWKYGPVKDAERKEHPCLVPYAALPIAERLKDYIFGAIVHAMWEAQRQEPNERDR